MAANNNTIIHERPDIPTRAKNLLGLRFGKLQVVAPASPYRQPNGTLKSTWECLCDCGATTYARSNDLWQGHTVSCGCKRRNPGPRAFKSVETNTADPRFQDLTGQEFGSLTILSLAPSRPTPSGRRRTAWNCQCICGAKLTVSAGGLRSGKSRSCGCSRRPDPIGSRFRMLVVMRQGPPISGKDGGLRSTWVCQCDCGNETTVELGSLRSGCTVSCGCYQSRSNLEAGGPNHKRSAEYQAWAGMIGRCHNQNSRAFRWYGGRGISVCSRWRESYRNFLEDMGRRPTPKHSIDRADNNKGYSPDNCRWATKREQSENTRVIKFYTFNGETLSLRGWEEKTGISRRALRARIERGWSIERTLTEETQTKFKGAS